MVEAGRASVVHQMTLPESGSEINRRRLSAAHFKVIFGEGLLVLVTTVVTLSQSGSKLRLPVQLSQTISLHLGERL